MAGLNLRSSWQQNDVASLIDSWVHTNTMFLLKPQRVCRGVCNGKVFNSSRLGPRISKEGYDFFVS